MEANLNEIGNARKSSVQRYKEEMEKVLPQGYVPSDKLLGHHLSARREAIDVFETESPKQPNDGYQAGMRELENDLEKCRITYDGKNTEKREATAKKIQEIREKMSEQYNTAITKYVGKKYIDRNELDEQHCVLKEVALGMFKSESPKEPKDVYVEAITQLSDYIEKCHVVANGDSVGNKERMGESCDMIVEKKKKEYLTEMENFFRDNYVELAVLEERHRSVKEKLLSDFTSDEITAEFFEKNHKKLLADNLDSLFENPVKLNNEKNNKFWRTMGNSVKGAFEGASSGLQIASEIAMLHPAVRPAAAIIGGVVGFCKGVFSSDETK